MRHHPLFAAGSAFVVAWLTGLFVAPAAPEMDAPAADVTAHYAAHGGATAAQSVLIHGIAGVALIAFALALTDRRPPRLAGVAAGAVSLFQAAVGIDLAAGGPAVLFDVLNVADTVKLAFAGAFIWMSAPELGARTARAAKVVAPLQVVAGAAFVTGSATLYALLYVALPALLIWVGAVACAAAPSLRWGRRADVA